MGVRRFICRFLWLAFLMIGGVDGAIVAPKNQVDEWVFSKQKELGFTPSEICSDEVFVRRIYIDVIGTVPTVDEVRLFLEDPSLTKRSQLVDALLERDEFAVYMGMKWCDLLRVKSEFPSNLWPNAVQAYHRWVVDAFRKNMPYDEFARTLLISSGSNFRDATVNFYRPFQQRTPRNILDTVALVFMGMRLEHSGWTEDELLGIDAFFAKVAYKKTSEWKEEIVYFDPTATFLHPDKKNIVLPSLPGEDPITLGTFDDPRIAFADWLTAPDNPWFAKAIVNRIWYHLMGRGLIHEVDDIHPDNPAWSPELLAYLERELVENKYDLKHIYRQILNSATYQLSSIPTAENIKDETGFSRYRVRRMDAEVLIDAVCQITGTFEEYSSAVPEPFTYIPKEQRSIMLADGSIKSSFLELFGRPGRDTSYESERNNNVSVFQSMHMLNSSHFQNKIMRSPLLKKLLRMVKSPTERIDELYLHILSRYPTEEEKDLILNYLSSSGLSSNDVVYDLAWCLINSKEFILRH